MTANGNIRPFRDDGNVQKLDYDYLNYDDGCTQLSKCTKNTIYLGYMNSILHKFYLNKAV